MFRGKKKGEEERGEGVVCVVTLDIMYFPPIRIKMSSRN